MAPGIQNFLVGLFLGGPAIPSQVRKGTTGTWQTPAERKPGTFQWDISGMIMTWKKQHGMHQKSKQIPSTGLVKLVRVVRKCSQPEGIGATAMHLLALESCRAELP